MTDSAITILIVDDDPKYLFFLQLNLQDLGYRILTAANGETALTLLQQHHPDLILLDVMIPHTDGFEICHQIRQFSTVPIIMVTAKKTAADKVTGLNLGADDYLTKPFDIDELDARIKANLRRLTLERQQLESAKFHLGALVINRVQPHVSMAGREIPLTDIEYRLLLELSKYPNQVVSSTHLLKTLWGDETVTDVQVLRQTVYRLRHKLETDPKNPQYLQARPRLGYTLTAPK